MVKLNEELSIMAKKYPDKAAFIYQDKETSYREFERQVKKFASGLEQLGYQKGDHIALIAWNSPLYVIAFYGLLRMGAVIIPIKPILTAKEMKYILKDGNVKAIITMDELLGNFEAIADQLPTVNHYIICESGADIPLEDHLLRPKLKLFAQLLEEGSNEFDAPFLNEEDTSIILYTSGTTGKPKGAMLSNKNLYINAMSTADFLKYNGNDRVISVLPMVHVFCVGAALCGPLLKGATLLIMPKFSPKEVFRIAKDHKATIFAGVPTMYNYLLQTAKKQTIYQKSFSGIRLCLSGGASIPLSLLNDFEKIFHVTITEGYGMSEAAPVAYNPVNRPPKPGSIGKSVTHVECRIVDDSGKEVVRGEVGELLVKGPNVMKGYYHLPEETAEALENGWLHTGDLVRMDEDGYYYIIDRIKDMIIVSGYNVYPREVEEVLNEHPYVFEAAVVGVAHQDTGEAIIGFVAVNSSITEETLIDFCKKNLAKYKVPCKIEILDELPKNATGKIIKKNLLTMVSDHKKTADAV